MLSSISGLGETGPEQEWSNGTEFSGNSDFPEFYANLARYTENSERNSGKPMSIPFASLPEISGIFRRMESALSCLKFNENNNYVMNSSLFEMQSDDVKDFHL